MNVAKRFTDESVIWANRGGKRPLYKPICGYTGTECPQNITIYILIGVGLVLLLLVATLGGIGYAVRLVVKYFWNLQKKIFFKQRSFIKEASKIFLRPLNQKNFCVKHAKIPPFLSS